MPPEELPPEEFYSRHAQKQADTRGETEIRPRYGALRDYFLSTVQGDRILDAGCGHGRDVDYFTQQGFEAVGIDLASGMLGYARDNHRGEFVEMDMRDMSFGNGEFHGIWGSASLFFLPRQEIETCLKEFQRILAPGGVLQANFKEGEGEHRKERWGDAVIEHKFQDPEIREMLEQSGFHVVSRTTNESIGGNAFLNYLCRKSGEKA